MKKKILMNSSKRLIGVKEDIMKIVGFMGQR